MAEITTTPHPERFFLPRHPAFQAVMRLSATSEALRQDAWTAIPGLNTQAAQYIGGYLQLLQTSQRIVVGQQAVSQLPEKIREDVGRSFQGLNAFPPGRGIGGVGRYAAEAIVGGIVMAGAHRMGVPPIIGEENIVGMRKRLVLHLDDLLALSIMELPEGLATDYEDAAYTTFVPAFLRERQQELAVIIGVTTKRYPDDREYAYRLASMTYLNYLLHMSDAFFRQDLPQPSENPLLPEAKYG